MSPPRKRARRSLETTIHSLPDEVLCMVFDRLPTCDVIRAALTCHRWNDVIFSSNYNSGIALQVMAYNTQLVAKSQRCYRNVVWIAHDRAILSTWKTIYRKFMNNLHSLKVFITDIKKKSRASVFTLIAEAIPHMTKLRTLKVIDGYVQDIPHQDNTPTLRSDSITSLTLLCKFTVWVDMPQLESFRGSLYTLNTPDECTQTHALDKLKELIVQDVEEPLQLSTAAVISIIRQLKNIKKMVWHNPIEEEIFDAICELCTKLKKFTFRAPISHCNVFNMSNLNKLTDLRSLGISSMVFEQHSALDCISLAQIEHLHLRFTAGVAVKIPKSIKKLEVVMTRDNKKSMIKSIISGAAHLKALKVKFFGNEEPEEDYDEPVKLLKALSHLRQLEVLKLKGGRFNASSFLRMNVPLRRVRTLQFRGAELVSTKSVSETRKMLKNNAVVCSNCGVIRKMSPSIFNFVGLERRFPRLKVPRFARCTLIPRDMK